MATPPIRRLAALFCAALWTTASALAAPSPVLRVPMGEWDLTHEPALVGGAKSFEETTRYGNHPSEGKRGITLDAKGEYARVETTLAGDPKQYVKAYKRNQDGDVEEITSSIVEKGSEYASRREKGVYGAKRKLSGIHTEFRGGANQEWQAAGPATLETDAHGDVTVTQLDRGKVFLTLVVNYDKNGRAIKARDTSFGRTEVMTFTRNDAGLVTGAVSDGGASMAIQYEMDAKGNWTKATVAMTRIVKGKDGKDKKMKQTQEIIRKITY